MYGAIYGLNMLVQVAVPLCLQVKNNVNNESTSMSRIRDHLKIAFTL